jgi:hypothetical protein
VLYDPIAGFDFECGRVLPLSTTPERSIQMRTGGIGGSLFLIALGAILYWAVSIEGEGFDINMIGLILLIVGIIGLVLTLIMTASAEENTGQSDVTIVER